MASEEQIRAALEEQFGLITDLAADGVAPADWPFDDLPLMPVAFGHGYNIDGETYSLWLEQTSDGQYRVALLMAEQVQAYFDERYVSGILNPAALGDTHKMHVRDTYGDVLDKAVITATHYKAFERASDVTISAQDLLSSAMFSMQSAGGQAAPDIDPPPKPLVVEEPVVLRTLERPLTISAEEWATLGHLPEDDAERKYARQDIHQSLRTMERAFGVYFNPSSDEAAKAQAESDIAQAIDEVPEAYKAVAKTYARDSLDAGRMILWESGGGYRTVVYKIHNGISAGDARTRLENLTLQRITDDFNHSARPETLAVPGFEAEHTIYPDRLVRMTLPKNMPHLPDEQHAVLGRVAAEVVSYFSGRDQSVPRNLLDQFAPYDEGWPADMWFIPALERRDQDGVFAVDQARQAHIQKSFDRQQSAVEKTQANGVITPDVEGGLQEAITYALEHSVQAVVNLRQAYQVGDKTQIDRAVSDLDTVFQVFGNNDRVSEDDMLSTMGSAYAYAGADNTVRLNGQVYVLWQVAAEGGDVDHVLLTEKELFDAFEQELSEFPDGGNLDDQYEYMRSLNRFKRAILSTHRELNRGTDRDVSSDKINDLKPEMRAAAMRKLGMNEAEAENLETAAVRPAAPRH